MKTTLLKALLLWLSLFCSVDGLYARILPGAYQMDEYLPLLKNKKVGLLINQTSEINGTPLLDTLLSCKVNVVKIFVPEHGFRGTADAGQKVKNDIDTKTGLPVISLYGNNKKPSPQQLKDLDVLIYDLQDVGVRFYTYISTLQYAMEACAENNKQIIILDRPNPLANKVDGPVLDTSLRSFVGMQPIPIVYGLTVGEYAQMLLGEKWVKAPNLKLSVINIKNYKRNQEYVLPVAPSPNLRSNTAIYLYPSLCLFEGTVVSIGRGTDKPFQHFGHPAFSKVCHYSFTPQSVLGASKPLLEGQACYGELVATDVASAAKKIPTAFTLSYLIKAYQWYPQKDKFFNNFFEKLIGDKHTKTLVVKGVSEDKIRLSWKPKLEAYKQIRKKYLMYEE